MMQKKITCAIFNPDCFHTTYCDSAQFCPMQSANRVPFEVYFFSISNGKLIATQFQNSRDPKFNRRLKTTGVQNADTLPGRTAGT